MKIKSISRENYSGKVYNIGTLPNHNYFANNILVHNCYKSNTTTGQNMSLETFKSIFHKLPDTITQIAFGIGSLDTNPDLYNIMSYCREKDVIPNITINGADLTHYHIMMLASLCGAVAVSRYNSDNCYNAVYRLTKEGIKQVNIHQLLSQNTLKECYKVIDDYKSDIRLKKLNAIVFLLLKPKGNRNKYNQLKDIEEYKKLIQYALDKNVPIGFDSCSAINFIKSARELNVYKQFKNAIEPCESSLFSIYIDVKGNVLPCSFSPGIDWVEPINLLEVNNFVDEVWNNIKIKTFRDRLLNKERNCPLYNLDME